MTNRYKFLLEDKAQWFAIHTKYKCEKLVSRLLQKKQIEAYAPIQKKARLRSGKVTYVELPLISCYVFVRIKRSEYVKVLETEHVSAFAKLSGELMPIPDDSIAIMKRIVQDDDLDVSAEHKGFQEGEVVTITSGSMTGVMGTIFKQDSKRFFSVALNNLDYDLVISIDAAFLSKTGLQL